MSEERLRDFDKDLFLNAWNRRNPEYFKNFWSWAKTSYRDFRRPGPLDIAQAFALKTKLPKILKDYHSQRYYFHCLDDCFGMDVSTIKILLENGETEDICDPFFETKEIEEKVFYEIVEKDLEKRNN